VASKKQGVVGRKQKYIPFQLKDEIKQTHFSNRSTIRSLSSSLGIPTTTMWRIKKNGDVFKRITSVLRLHLTEQNKLTRFLFSIEHINKRTMQYETFYDRIVVDEKWFYLTQYKQGYYVAVDEEPPTRRVNNKHKITKVMFLCAVARPRHCTSTNSIFDGKIGIWPIGGLELAKRNSKNHRRGDPLWRNENVTRNVYRKILINDVLPAIKKKFPCATTKKIILQQDGAPCHILSNDAVFKKAAEKMGLDISILTQPANSPDLNILDLGFFRAIMALSSG
jgi:hypothetical protein